MILIEKNQQFLHSTHHLISLVDYHLPLLYLENDVLRDEVEAYAHKLMQAGVPTTATLYLGPIHDFVMLNAIADTPAARGAIDQASDTLKEVLSK